MIGQKRILIENSWLGNGQAKISEYLSAGLNVHRIKVDCHGGFVIATSGDGGLFVLDLQNDRLLWALPAVREPPPLLRAQLTSD